MEELHTGNGPLSDANLADHPALDEQPSVGYLEHRSYPEAAGELPEELPKGIVQRLEDLQRRLGRCEGRLELTRISETILRKQLKRESERADRLERELHEAEAELRTAEVALHKARSSKARRGWLGRFFGVESSKQ